MKRWIYVSQTTQGPVEPLWSAFCEHGREALHGGDEQSLHADGSFAVRIHVPGFPLAPALRVAIGVGVELRDGRRVVPLTWAAETAEIGFPQFDGAVEFEPLSTRVARVSIVGSYVPPFGPVGAALDAALLHRAADATASILLARLVDGMLRAWDPSQDRQASDGRTDSTSMTVGDVMTVDPFVVPASLPLKTAALLLFHLDVSGAPVVGPDGELVGVVTERDLLDKEAAPPRGVGVFDESTWRRRQAMTAGDVCSRPALTTAPAVSLHEAVAEMQRHRVGRLVVVDHAGIAGIVTRHDVLVALIRNDAEILHVVNEVLQSHGEHSIEARVDWGIVALAGKASLRSRRDRVMAIINNIDGVLGVDADDLHWDVDDVMPAALPPMA